MKGNSNRIVRLGSHLPVLIKVVSVSSGPILELGTGQYSTPVLHWMCATSKRPLVSYESDLNWFNNFSKHFAGDFHQVYPIENWGKAFITRTHWSVVFIDLFPPDRRAVEARRVANIADYVILHDSEPGKDHAYHYNDIYPYFKWKFDYNLYTPNTTVLSNFQNLDIFFV